jgi:hypothetical protein
MQGRIILSLAAALALSACATGYRLVEPVETSVAKAAFRVQPTTAWNRSPRGTHDIAEEENWTANGPALDMISFVGGLAPGKAIVKQRKKADQKVPLFDAAMTPQDLTSMIETLYRIRGATLFETTAVEPATFLGAAGFRFDYDYVAGDDVKRRGRSVGAIVGGKFYLMTLDAARLHYFDAARPEFDRMVASARLG